jgi:hypothetical protein
VRGRLVIVIGAVAVGMIACGLSVVGAGEDVSPAVEAGAGTNAETGSEVTDAADEPLDPPPPRIDPFDGGIDASPDNCKAACTGGTCDGGWCVIACDGGSCPNTVTCPPGIPCDVQCVGKDACKSGVDCAEATACNVLCSGAAACSNQKVRCKGSACQVTCTGKDACTTSIVCDAGTCALRCLDDATCKNGAVTCNSDRCSVECGVSGKNGEDSCVAGVTCNATTSCDIRCRAENSCQNGAVVAVAGATANVSCEGMNSCAGGVVTSAPDSGIRCTRAGACSPGGVQCSGGQCATHCKDTDIQLCCDAGVCLPTADKCKIEGRCQ